MDAMISQLVITIVVVTLFLWRISYGTKNGLFAEAAGLIAVITAFAAIYFLMNITKNIMGNNYVEVIKKIGYLVIALIIYGVMRAIARAVSGVKKIPILGGLDRFLGAILGGIEAWLIIYVVEYITGMEIFGPVMEVWAFLSAQILGKIKTR